MHMHMSKIDRTQEWLFNQPNLYAYFFLNNGGWHPLIDQFSPPFNILLFTLDTVKKDIYHINQMYPFIDMQQVKAVKISRYIVDGKYVICEVVKHHEFKY